MNCPNRNLGDAPLTDYRCLTGEYVGKTPQGTSCTTIISEDGYIRRNHDGIELPTFKLDHRFSYWKTQQGESHDIQVTGSGGPIIMTGMADMLGTPSRHFQLQYKSARKELIISIQNRDTSAPPAAHSSCRTLFPR